MSLLKLFRKLKKKKEKSVKIKEHPEKKEVETKVA